MSKTQSIRDAVAARLPRRHRAEQRFQAYGLAAIVLAVIFLAVLIGSILVQSIPAFTAHRMSLPVTLEATLVDPRGDGGEASLRRGSYNAAIQASLREQFPDVDGRAQLRDLFGLYSAVNAARLLNQVVADPSLVGQTVEFEFPISDDADLYLKGRSVEERFVAGPGPISIAAAGEDATLSAETPVFAAFAEALRAGVAERADAADARAARALARAGETIDPDERQVLQAEAERATALAQRLRMQLAPDTLLRLGAQDQA